METLESGPCSWPVSYGFCKTNALDSLDADVRDLVVRTAVDYLWNWSGRQFGECPVTVRPCRPGCDQVPIFWESPISRHGVGASYAAMPASLLGSGAPLDDAPLVGFACGSCASTDPCGCADETRDSMRLPGPISRIEEIRIDGKVLPPPAYRVDDRAVLVRMDGAAWPTCQDLSLSPDEPGTWQVTYLRGREVPSGGQVAAGILATEMAKQLCGDNDCQLPARLQSVTRQGVTSLVLDPMDNLDKGYTGIWLVDSWLSSVTRPPRAGRVFSPDIPRNRFRQATS